MPGRSGGRPLSSSWRTILGSARSGLDRPGLCSHSKRYANVWRPTRCQVEHRIGSELDGCSEHSILHGVHQEGGWRMDVQNDARVSNLLGRSTHDRTMMVEARTAHAAFRAVPSSGWLPAALAIPLPAPIKYWRCEVRSRVINRMVARLFTSCSHEFAFGW